MRKRYWIRCLLETVLDEEESVKPVKVVIRQEEIGERMGVDGKLEIRFRPVVNFRRLGRYFEITSYEDGKEIHITIPESVYNMMKKEYGE